VNIAYMIYQAERPRTAAERRAEAARSGELAKAISHVLRGRRDAGAAQSAGPALTLVREDAASAASQTRTPCTWDTRRAS
jgi:hypothetical protein